MMPWERPTEQDAFSIFNRYKSGAPVPGGQSFIDASGRPRSQAGMHQPGIPYGLQLSAPGYGQPAGVAGPTGPAGVPQMGGFSNSAAPGVPSAPPTPSGGAGWGGAPIRPPSENSMQRAQTEAETQNEDAQMRGLSPQRRYFWATGRVDARATQAPQNARTDFDSTFGPDRPHMGAPGTTWAERQARNAQGVSKARSQRGLDNWSAY